MNSATTELTTAMAELAREHLDGEGRHPDLEELTDYRRGRISPLRRDAVQEHLAWCRECADVYLDLATFVPAPAPRLVDRLAIVARRIAGWVVPRGGASAAAALAAVLAGWGLNLGFHFLFPPWLPPFRLGVEGAVRAFRAGPEEPPAAARRFAFAPGGRFDLLARPEVAVDEPLELSVFKRRGSSLEAWPLAASISAKGVASAGGTVGQEVQFEPGPEPTRVVVVLARPGRAPSPAELAARLAAAGEVRDRNWMAWQLEVTLAKGP